MRFFKASNTRRVQQRLSVLILLAVALHLGFIRSTAEESHPSATRLVAQRPTQRLKTFMRKKLVASEQIMEGLTTPNYALIRKGATSMIHMAKESIWETHATVVYTQDSADFVRTAERLVRLANASDLEGAAQTYARLTLQCVDCHRRVRSDKVVAVPQNAVGVALRTPPHTGAKGA